MLVKKTLDKIAAFLNELVKVKMMPVAGKLKRDEIIPKKKPQV